MFSSLMKISVIVLTLRLIVIESEDSFCTILGGIPESDRKNPDNVKFIPTANGSYIFLNNSNSHWVFKFHSICNYGQKCPNIQLGLKLSEFTDNRLESLSKKRCPFIHNGITYLYGNSVDRDGNKIGIKMYANGTTDWIYVTNQWIDKSVKTYAICYSWDTNIKHVQSVFVPPFVEDLPIGTLPEYGFSFDLGHVNDVTVEVTGNYPKVVFVFHQKPYLYSFGEYIVPCLYKQYILLPNGDALAIIDSRQSDEDSLKYDVLYIRSDSTGFRVFSSVNLITLFGCDGKQIPPKTLKDYKTDNIYSYFNKD